MNYLFDTGQEGLEWATTRLYGLASDAGALPCLSEPRRTLEGVWRAAFLALLEYGFSEDFLADAFRQCKADDKINGPRQMIVLCCRMAEDVKDHQMTRFRSHGNRALGLDWCLPRMVPPIPMTEDSSRKRSGWSRTHARIVSAMDLLPDDERWTDSRGNKFTEAEYLETAEAVTPEASAAPASGDLDDLDELTTRYGSTVRGSIADWEAQWAVALEEFSLADVIGAMRVAFRQPTAAGGRVDGPGYFKATLARMRRERERGLPGDPDRIGAS